MASNNPPETQVAEGPVAHWKDMVKASEAERELWIKRGERIVKRYRDDRGEDKGETRDAQRKLNIFWSNVQTIKPCVFSRVPVPVAERRFMDRDPVGRTAAIILERSMRYELEGSTFDGSVGKAVLDYLLVAQGQCWVRYDPVFGSATSVQETGDEPGEEGDEQQEPEEGADNDDEADSAAAEPQSDKLLSEAVMVDYLNWKDFLTFPAKARVWTECDGVGKRVYMSRDELIDRFGKETGEKVPLDHVPDSKHGSGNPAPNSEEFAKATVYEIWFKPERKVFWLAKEYAEMLDEKDDPLHLEGFWPCPEPLYGTLTNDTLIPVPDYTEYQDQALEIDDLTRRIGLLIDALKVAGCYDAANPALERILDEGNENKLVPVNQWAIFAEKGGLKSAMDFVPIDMVGQVLLSLYEAREKIKADLYEITGISDIIRGQSDPNETAEAQSIKGRFGSLRLQQRQADVARFCRDIIRIMGEVIAEHFAPATLVMISGAQNDEGIGPPAPKPPKPPEQSGMGHNGGPPMGGAPQGQPAPQGGPPQGQQPQQPAMAPPPGPPPEIVAYQQALAKFQADSQAAEQEKILLIGKALDLLKEEKLRGFRIDIETDTTIADQAGNDKKDTVEFVTAATGFIQQAMLAGQQYPAVVPLLGKMMQFAVRRFRTGRDLESAFDDFIDKATQDAKAKEASAASGQAKLDPELIKAQVAQATGQAEIAKAKIEAQSEQTNEQLRQQKSAMELQQAQAEHQAKLQQIKLDGEYHQQAHQQRMAELAMKREIALVNKSNPQPNDGGSR